jgi:hypothetical protein
MAVGNYGYRGPNLAPLLNHIDGVLQSRAQHDAAIAAEQERQEKLRDDYLKTLVAQAHDRGGFTRGIELLTANGVPLTVPNFSASPHEEYEDAADNRRYRDVTGQSDDPMAQMRAFQLLIGDKSMGKGTEALFNLNATGGDAAALRHAADVYAGTAADGNTEARVGEDARQSDREWTKKGPSIQALTDERRAAAGRNEAERRATDQLGINREQERTPGSPLHTARQQDAISISDAKRGGSYVDHPAMAQFNKSIEKLTGDLRKAEANAVRRGRATTDDPAVQLIAEQLGRVRAGRAAVASKLGVPVDVTDAFTNPAFADTYQHKPVAAPSRSAAPDAGSDDRVPLRHRPDAYPMPATGIDPATKRITRSKLDELRKTMAVDTAGWTVIDQ